MEDEYVRRTAITRLSVDDAQREVLAETIAEWKRGCQLATDIAWGSSHTRGDVQDLAYDAIRAQTELGSQHAVLATHQAADAITGCREHNSRGQRVSKPTFTAATVPYDARCMTLFDDHTVSLSTTDSRIQCSLVLPETDDGYQQQYLNGDWTVARSTLTRRHGEYFLHIGFRRIRSATERDRPEDGTVLGVDLGVENIAVTSTAHFVPGRELAHQLRRFEQVRGGLQQTGTRSAHRTLDRLSGRVLRYTRDVLHQASNVIIAEALKYDCEIIVFERLDSIRNRTGASWGHRWAFRQLLHQVRYKTETLGIAVMQVEASHTSTQCADCGYIDGGNRRNRTSFQCGECGSTANADYNAAKNIGMRYVRRGLQSSRRTGNSQLALKSGTVTPNGGFTAYQPRSEVEITDKSTAG